MMLVSEILPTVLRVVEVFAAVTVIATFTLTLSYVFETRRRVKDLEDKK